MQILSEFLYDQKRLYIPFDNRRMIFSQTLKDDVDFTLNGIPILHERYVELDTDKFSLLSEAALITHRIISKLDHNKIIITSNSIVSINPNTHEATIKKHGSNLISYDDGKTWLTTLQNFDDDGNPIVYDFQGSFGIKERQETNYKNSHSVRVILITSISDVRPRTYVENNIYLEHDGKYYPNGLETNYMPRPAWCIISKL